MIWLLLLLYGVPVYLIFFKCKWVPLTTFWKVFLWAPPIVGLVFLWFALGRYTPLAPGAYVPAPVVQVAPRVGGSVTELAVKDNQEVAVCGTVSLPTSRNFIVSVRRIHTCRACYAEFFQFTFQGDRLWVVHRAVWMSTWIGSSGLKATKPVA